jgi:hypothetical protein
MVRTTLAFELIEFDGRSGLRECERRYTDKRGTCLSDKTMAGQFLVGTYEPEVVSDGRDEAFADMVPGTGSEDGETERGGPVHRGNLAASKTATSIPSRASAAAA